MFLSYANAENSASKHLRYGTITGGVTALCKICLFTASFFSISDSFRMEMISHFL